MKPRESKSQPSEWLTRNRRIIAAPEDPVSRRHMIQALAGALTAPAFLRGVRADSPGSLFTLGVASGDPSSRSVMLWSRLAPDPLNGGGMGDQVVEVAWEVATDPGMGQVIRSGFTVAHPRRGHTVQARVSGLPPDSWLYYRFRALGEYSRIGRTRTFPDPWETPGMLRFALASCQNYQQGFYAAYADMTEQNLDCVVHVGDYIYEDGPTDTPIDDAGERIHNSPEIRTVDDYRNRYALYRLDSNLQDAHARFPFLVTWDDHEVDNNYAGEAPEDGQTRMAFLERRRAAYQVYSEYMPIRPESRLRSRRMRLFRALDFGRLARFLLLDTRQFRTDQPCGDNLKSLDPTGPPLTGFACADPTLVDSVAAQMLGIEQERWLTRRLMDSQAQWNFLAQQVMVMPWNLGPAAGLNTLLNMDAWDGYRVARERLLGFLAAERPSNPIVLTGDVHSAWAANLLEDFTNLDSDLVAAEFVCNSISSNFAGDSERAFQATESSILSNPHIEYFNPRRRGYAMCTASSSELRTEFRGVVDCRDPESPAETLATAAVGAGFNRPGSRIRVSVS